MHAEDLLIHNRSEWHPVKRLIDHLVDLEAEPSWATAEFLFALSQEAASTVVVFPTVHVADFVVAPQQVNLSRRRDLQR